MSMRIVFFILNFPLPYFFLDKKVTTERSELITTFNRKLKRSNKKSSQKTERSELINSYKNKKIRY
jgi:hypothetical protein